MRESVAARSGIAPGAPTIERPGGNPAENYERYFVPAIGAPLAADLIEAAALDAGERVLDVACGTGIAARLAAKRVGRTGSVLGLDVNPGMLDVARTVAGSGEAIAWREADVHAIPLPAGSYDAALCGLGLQFFVDKPAALREVRRVLAPGGRLAANVPGHMPRIFTILGEGLRDHVTPEATRFVSTVFSLHDTTEVRKLLEGAGFEDTSVGVGTKSLRLGPPSEFLWQYVSSTPLVDAIAALDERTLAALQRDVVGRWEQCTDGGPLTLELEVVTATARRN